MKEVTAAIPPHLMADPKADFPKAKNTMGKDDFMKLLMAQLQHQDPLKPMENQEFVAQLAQFGSLEQLTNIQKGIDGLSSGNKDEAKLSALGMIGKHVQATGNDIDLREGSEVTLRYGQKEGLTPVSAQIYTDGGKLVREIDLGGKADSQEVHWDGKDADGKNLPSGKYTFRVQGVSGSGQAEELGTELSGRVTGVEMDGKDALLVVQTPSGTSRLSIAKVHAVSVEDGKKQPAQVNQPTTKPAVTQAIKPPEEDDSEEKPAASFVPINVPRALQEGNRAEQAEAAAEDLPSVADLDKGMWQGFMPPSLSENVKP